MPCLLRGRSALYVSPARWLRTQQVLTSEIAQRHDTDSRCMAVSIRMYTCTFVCMRQHSYVYVHSTRFHNTAATSCVGVNGVLVTLCVSVCVSALCERVCVGVCANHKMNQKTCASIRSLPFFTPTRTALVHLEPFWVDWVPSRLRNIALLHCRSRDL